MPVAIASAASDWYDLEESRLSSSVLERNEVSTRIAGIFTPRST